MKKIGIFFGSDTGNTENAAKLINNKIGSDLSTIHDISCCSREDIEKYQYLIFGVPTWYYGEVQCDWDDFIPVLKKIKFKNKTIALFGFGDQEDYSEYFCDAIGVLYKILKKNHANIIGKWPVKDYNFESSKALLNKDYFMGLTLDDDRQPKKTSLRIESWIQEILPYFNTST